MDHVRGYPMPEQPEGETLRAKIEDALGYPVTSVIDPSPVRVLAVGDVLEVHLEADDEPGGATWAKIDKLFEAHRKDPTPA